MSCPTNIRFPQFTPTKTKTTNSPPSALCHCADLSTFGRLIPISPTVHFKTARRAARSAPTKPGRHSMHACLLTVLVRSQAYAIHANSFISLFRLLNRIRGDCRAATVSPPPNPQPTRKPNRCCASSVCAVYVCACASSVNTHNVSIICRLRIVPLPPLGSHTVNRDDDTELCRRHRAVAVPAPIDPLSQPTPRAHRPTSTGDQIPSKKYNHVSRSIFAGYSPATDRAGNATHTHATTSYGAFLSRPLRPLAPDISRSVAEATEATRARARQQDEMNDYWMVNQC